MRESRLAMLKQRDYFIQVPNMIGDASFRRSSSEAKVPVPGHHEVSETASFSNSKAGVYTPGAGIPSLLRGKIG